MVFQKQLYCLRLLSAVLALQWNVANAFYVPGVAPTEYRQGDLLDIKVSSVIIVKYLLLLSHHRLYP